MRKEVLERKIKLIDSYLEEIESVQKLKAVLESGGTVDINGENVNLTTDIIRYLGIICRSDQIDYFIDIFNKHSDPDIRLIALQQIEKFAGKNHIDMLMKIVQDRNEEDHTRRTAIRAIGSIGGKEQLRPLVDLFKDEQENESLRAGLIETIAKLGSEEQLQFIIQSLEYYKGGKVEHNNYSIVEELIKAIGKLGNRNHLPLLQQFIKQDGVSIKETAIKAIAEIIGIDMVPFLLESLTFENKSRPTDYDYILQGIKKPLRSQELANNIQLIGILGNSEHLNTLKKFLRYETNNEKRTIIIHSLLAAISRIGGKDELDFLRSYLQNSSAVIQELVCYEILKYDDSKYSKQIYNITAAINKELSSSTLILAYLSDKYIEDIKYQPNSTNLAKIITFCEIRELIEYKLENICIEENPNHFLVSNYSFLMNTPISHDILVIRSKELEKEKLSPEPDEELLPLPPESDEELPPLPPEPDEEELPIDVVSSNRQLKEESGIFHLDTAKRKMILEKLSKVENKLCGIEDKLKDFKKNDGRDLGSY